MKAIKYELFWGRYQTPSEGLWKAIREVRVINETKKSIKVKEYMWKPAKWYLKEAIGVRFEKINNSNVCPHCGRELR